MGIFSGLSEVAKVTGLSNVARITGLTDVAGYVASTLVNPLVDGVLGQVTTIRQQWTDDILKPFDEIWRQVEAGDIWTGAGADLFVQDCARYAPAVEDVADKIASQWAGLTDGREIINQADKAADQVAEGFAELVGKIF